MQCVIKKTSFHANGCYLKKFVCWCMHDKLAIIQQSRLTEIGKYLQQVRLDAKISLHEVSKVTHIRQSYLEAIEMGELKNLPEPIYVRGFIRQYANVLSLQGQELAMTFPLDL